jgi:hypothetical protein
MFRPTSLLVASVLTFVLAPAAEASPIVWDYSPSATGATSLTPASNGGTVWVNQAGNQNFAERVIFSGPMLIDGMSIYTGAGFVNLGESVTIRLYSDVGGAPGSLLAQFTTTLSAIDTNGNGGFGANIVQAHADFVNPQLLNANTAYWIGMSGTASEIGLVGLGGVTPGNGAMGFFNGTTYLGQAGIGDMAFRLNGVPAPEPSTLALLGFLTVGAVCRRRFRRAPQAL